MTTVLIVDDHEVIRRGLSNFLALTEDLEVVAQAATGGEAVRLVRQLEPDVVLMDLVLPDQDGVQAIRAIKHAAPETQVIALTSYHGTDLVVDALRAGAIGFLLKDIGALGLRDAIRAAREGRSTLAAHATQAVLGLTAGQPRAAHQHGLTERELDVLRLMVRGLTNAQIAQQLVVSRATANFHVSSILAKLGAETRTRAVALALQDRLVAA
jgi:NarL family two-component system response regulator LiaR